MVRRMLIDAAHPEETRVAVVAEDRLEEFDFESATKAQLKGNIFLARVVRVEPSLQAAFVEYGGTRHGFLGFHEIHPDYYQLPVEDREEFEQWITNAKATASDTEVGEELEEIPPDGERHRVKLAKLRMQFFRRYKIQEVIKRRQILLVQVVKEERGNKGAALTTYLSLAGRYVVLMPNSERGGGVSRKITNAQDRQRLKEIMSSLEVPEGMGLVVRTAGVGRSKTDLKKDYDYLLKTWEQIRSTTLQSTAPCLVHEEASLIKRAIRDMYTRDVEEILVEGEGGYKIAKAFTKSLMPSHARRVQLFKEGGGSLFSKYGLEEQIAAIYEARVDLPSGGYIVLGSTEALVAIDVNSGRSTRDRNVEETALRTNLEAAAEIARQLRIRDLAGLVVIDFIDMMDSRHNANVERCFKEAIKSDRARIQVGKISNFGLLELSRQRLRPSIFESSASLCLCCHGMGVIRSTESIAIHILRTIEKTLLQKGILEVHVAVPQTVGEYLLNQKRGALSTLEREKGVSILVHTDLTLSPSKFDIQITAQEEPPTEEEDASPQEIACQKEKPQKDPATQPTGLLQDESSAGSGFSPTEAEESPPSKTSAHRSRRRRRRPLSADGETIEPKVSKTIPEAVQATAQEEAAPLRAPKKRSRRRRSGRGPTAADGGGRTDGEEHKKTAAFREISESSLSLRRQQSEAALSPPTGLSDASQQEPKQHRDFFTQDEEKKDADKSMNTRTGWWQRFMKP